MGTMAAQHWQPEQTSINGKMTEAGSAQLFNVVIKSKQGQSATRVQTPWFPAWSITCFPPQSETQPWQTKIQMTASDVTSYQEFMGKYETCERQLAAAMGPVFYNQLGPRQQKTTESYSELLSSNVRRLQEDGAPFMRASMGRTCRTYYGPSVENGTDPGVVHMLPSVFDVCGEPEQKKMGNGGVFYVYQRSDPSLYLAAIMALDTFSFKKAQSGEAFCQVQPRVEQLLLAPATDAYKQTAGSYVDCVSEERGFQFFDP